MPTLRNVNRHIQQRMKTTTGMDFYGYLWTSQTRNLPDTSFVQPRRFVRVDPACNLRTGMTIVTKSGARYLCADNVDEEYRDTFVSKSFRLFLVDRQLAWERDTLITDTITGLKANQAPVLQGTIWAAVEPTGTENDSIRVPQHRYRVIVGEDVLVNDKLDGMVVKSVTTQLGVRICEVAGFNG